MKKIGVGIVGFGFSSTTFHIPLLQTIEEYDIRAVLSSKEEVVKETFPILSSSNNFFIVKKSLSKRRL
ncbi:hypothetical protein ACT453_05360 [Bacillus sp. D-CC]